MEAVNNNGNLGGLNWILKVVVNVIREGGWGAHDPARINYFYHCIVTWWACELELIN